MACATGPPGLVRNPEELPVERNLKVIPMTQSQTEGQIPGRGPHSPTTVGTKRRSLRGWLAGIAVLLLFVGLLVSGILERIHTNASLRKNERLSGTLVLRYRGACKKRPASGGNRVS